MLKRVNIQYSIDLEDLPNEVDRIYINAKNIFSEISLPDATGKEILTADVLKRLDETRRELTRLDHALSDVSGIVGSYVEYELSKLTAAQKSSQESEHNVEDAPEMS